MAEMNFSNKKNYVLVAAALFLASCGSRHNVVVKREIPTKKVARAENLKILSSGFNGRLSAEVRELIKDAEKYLGAPYKYGGITSSGFDCSGFTGKVFAENSLNLPRRSTDQAAQGAQVPVEDVKPGDLVFFATTGGGHVSHVGIVHDIGADGEIKFIHASSSKGVVISSLNEKYWNNSFLFVRRVL